MDETLKSKLDEKGYNTSTLYDVDLDRAGYIISKGLYTAYRWKSVGALILDGKSKALVKTGLGNTTLDKNLLPFVRIKR